MDEYIADPNTHPANVDVVKAYKEGVRTSRTIQPSVHPHFINGKPDISMYMIRSCEDTTKPCDLGTKEWTWALQHQIEQSSHT